MQDFVHLWMPGTAIPGLIDTDVCFPHALKGLSLSVNAQGPVEFREPSFRKCDTLHFTSRNDNGLRSIFSIPVTLSRDDLIKTLMIE